MASDSKPEIFSLDPVTPPPLKSPFHTRGTSPSVIDLLKSSATGYASLQETKLSQGFTTSLPLGLQQRS